MFNCLLTRRFNWREIQRVLNQSRPHHLKLVIRLRFGGENGDARIQMLGGVMVPTLRCRTLFMTFHVRKSRVN